MQDDGGLIYMYRYIVVFRRFSAVVLLYFVEGRSEAITSKRTEEIYKIKVLSNNI